jgi:hypothetical protein
MRERRIENFSFGRFIVKTECYAPEQVVLFVFGTEIERNNTGTDS